MIGKTDGYGSGIRIETAQGVYKEYHFRTKKEVQQTQFLQDILKKFHAKKQDNKHKISCLCCPESSAKRHLSSKKLGDYYFLSNFPSNEAHHVLCPFFTDEKSEKLMDDNGHYNPDIFLELPVNKSDSIPERFIAEDNETRRKFTYTNFCRDIVSESIVYAFNVANKGKSKKNVVNYTKEQFLGSVWSILLRNTNFIKNNSTIIEAMPKGYVLELGVIHADFSKKIATDAKVLFVRAEKYFKKNDFSQTSYSFSPDKYQECIKHITNYNHVIKGPYFYIAIIKKNTVEKAGRNKTYNNVVRFFLHPISDSEESLVFVESDLERRYAQSLSSQGVAFLKPFIGNEIYRIKKGLFSYSLYGKEIYFDFNNYRPDFIEWRDACIDIVEVAGYRDANYIKSLTKKMDYFEKQCSKHHYNYRAKVVDQ